MPQYINDHLHVLIVEDDTIARQFLKEYLSEFGDCDIADSGEKAIKHFKDNFDGDPYDLVCLDIGLPDISGKKVLTEIRAFERNFGIEREEAAKIIMTTATTGMKEVLRCMDLGCDGYIVKPFSREQLLNELNKIGMTIHWE